MTTRRGFLSSVASLALAIYAPSIRLEEKPLAPVLFSMEEFDEILKEEFGEGLDPLMTTDPVWRDYQTAMEGRYPDRG